MFLVSMFARFVHSQTVSGPETWKEEIMFLIVPMFTGLMNSQIVS